MDGPILVTGGTGTLGRPVVRRFLDDGRTVRVLSRRPRPADDTTPYEWAMGDMRTGAGIDRAVAGADTIVHCATVGRRGDVEGTRLLVDAVRRQGGSPHLVYISIVGIDRIPYPYYRAKLETERLIEVSGLPWTVLRTTQFHDLIAMITEAQRRLPVTLSLSGVRFQPVEVREVADRLVELAAGEPAGRVPDMGGPEVRTHTDLARSCLVSLGRRRRVVPLWLPGSALNAVRRGENLTPDHAVGRGTFEDFLAARAGGARAPGTDPSPRTRR
ncbi:NAD(P)H-binding protein [Streptomyces sp. NPDC051776]|uniref:SDR family oxidoreductase n=1 Tax=Streptomyces sp. NPDC051776 TaxID=3155414 RepID=UPI003446A25E